MLDNTKIGNFIAQARRGKGLTGEKFAEQLGVSPQAVSKWENGKCLPETALLPEIAAILGVTADEILNPPAPPGGGGPQANPGFELLSAYYGSGPNQRDVMHKMRHYDYFHWKEIHVDHESFPSSPGTDEPEALTLVYRNAAGIHMIACPEGGALRYSDDGTELFLLDQSRCVLPGVMVLEWEKGMDCCWAGALTAALQYMGEPWTYEHLMGVSGACYRLNFLEVWDWSATDALVAFDYCSPLMRAIGYENVFCDRLPKEERAGERQRIMNDLRRGKPVLGINLRVAAEWGVITGYSDNGKTFYCRSYFDFQDKNWNRNDYLETENWPFLIQHFGERQERPTALENLRASLRLLGESFEAPCERGYWQGREAYEKWIAGLRSEKLWTISLKNKKKDIRRRLGVNDSQLLNLCDARRCAAVYLRESAALLPGVEELAAAYEEIYARLRAFREKLKTWEGNESYPCDEGTARFTNDPAAHREEADLLAWCLEREAWIAEQAKNILQRLEDDPALYRHLLVRSYVPLAAENASGEIPDVHSILRAAAQWHAAFWGNRGAFGAIGLDWRLSSKQNLLAHIGAMEEDFKKYRKNEEAGKIPKTWEYEGHVFENHITPELLDRFADAIKRLKAAYGKLLDSRFYAGNNITVIHGNMQPNTAHITAEGVKFDGLQAVRIGLCTEDLAQLLALHIAPEKAEAQPLLDFYYQCLCEGVKGYAYETFMGDYKIAVMENMFFTIRQINAGIYDFTMRDKARRAFETFVMEDR